MTNSPRHPLASVRFTASAARLAAATLLAASAHTAWATPITTTRDLGIAGIIDSLALPPADQSPDLGLTANVNLVMIDLDGGRSTTQTMKAPVTHVDSIVNTTDAQRAVSSSLAIFARPVPEPSLLVLFAAGMLIAASRLARRRRRLS